MAEELTGQEGAMPEDQTGATAAAGTSETADVPEPRRDLIPGAAREGGGAGLDFILDLPLEISVELGRSTMLVGDLLQLGQGSVVELNKQAGEPLEILVNRKLVARGEAVVVNEKFGVRITDVVPADERVRRLG